MSQPGRTERRNAREGLRWSKIATWATIVGAAATIWGLQHSAGDNVDANVDGYCNAVGTNATACVTVDPYRGTTFGNALFSRSPEADSYVFLGAQEDLPQPPDYDTTDWTNHCSTWADWAQEQGLYAADNELLVSAQTGPASTLSIIEVTAQVIAATKPGKATIVTCAHGHGNGLYPGNRIVVNTVDRKTTAAKGSDNPNDPGGEPLPMPPASINLAGQDSTSATIQLKGQEGYAYTGIVTAKLIVDGQPKKVQFGSKERPYRWISRELVSQNGIDWNPLTQRWSSNIYQELGQG